MTFEAISLLASHGREDLIERIQQLLAAFTNQGKLRNLKSMYFYTRSNIIPALAELDLLQASCPRFGGRFEPCYEPSSAIRPLLDNDFEVAKWLYAMHRVHGTTFPSAEELGRVNGELSPEMVMWISTLVLHK
ncbi:hypothetical protein BC828DRAFT_400850 [Blastocladiella britannica]|nr:hypothetical protein BC828DRAFT_400850 [Blastocladiella britannica]